MSLSTYPSQLSDLPISERATMPHAPAPQQTVKVVKRYRYAGEEVTEVKEVPADSQEAKQWPLWTPSDDKPSSSPAPSIQPPTPQGPSATPAAPSSPPNAAASSSSTAAPSPFKPPPKRPGPRKPKKTLAPIQKKEPVKKLTTLDMSAMDWRAHVEGEAAASGVKDELEANRRGGGYLEKVEFLQRVEARKQEVLDATKGKRRRG
ncbi:hypothetical protein BN946_scf184829.g47 [Trametes cinnabarina]|uniref:SWR1-complex protein 5 n=1 Tax=Pycnoporus cinnabarinus TaxID=5643 RepID=A0A060SEW4_PYCCI|nr:hypothetical protein BN946_scf184829.g47 [Trametes cinnabarina]